MTDGREACPSFTSSPHRPAWYGLRLQSNREVRVQDALRAAAIPDFLPTYVEETRWSDRTKRTSRPLFPGYVFCHVAPEHFPLVRRIAGVVQILGAEFTPTPIPDAEIDNLRLAVASRVPLAECPYVAGETVRVDSGPLAGLVGVVERTKGATSVVVTLEILNRSVRVEVDAASVAKPR